MAKWQLSWQTANGQAGVQPKAGLADPLLSDEILLRNACWFISLRWIVIAFFGLTTLVLWRWGDWLKSVGIATSTEWPAVICITLLAANLFFTAITGTATSRLISPKHNIWLQIIGDLACLTVVVHFIGSTDTPAPFLYVIHIALACIFFSAEASLLVTLLATSLYLACVNLEYWEIWPAVNIFVAIDNLQVQSNFIMVAAAQSAAIAILMLIIWYVVSRLSQIIRERETQLLRAQAEIVAAQKEKEQYIMQMTHQLKSPLDVIRSNISLLTGGYLGDVPEAQLPVIKTIDERASLLGRLILDVLKLTKLKAFNQKAASVAEPVNLGEMLRNCIVELIPIAAGRKIWVKSQLEDLVTPAIPDQIQMLLNNLLVNAIAYSYDNGTVEVFCRKDEQSGQPMITVSDHGIGIPGDKLPHLFDEHFRTKEAIKHNKASTGIGMAIVKRIAEIHKIEIFVESELKVGTTFRLVFALNQKNR